MVLEVYFTSTQPLRDWYPIPMWVTSGPFQTQTKIKLMC